MWLRSYEDDGDLRDSPSVANIGHRAHMDSLRKSKSVKKGLRRRAQRGQLPGGPRPYGYRWVGPKGEKVLEVVDPEAKVVERIYADTTTASASARSPGRSTTRASHRQRRLVGAGIIARILANPLYRGQVRHMARSTTASTRRS